MHARCMRDAAVNMQGWGTTHLLALVEAGHGAVARRQHAGLDRVGGGGDLAVERDHQAAVGLHATYHAALKLLARLELDVRRVEAGHERSDQLALGPLEEVALPRLEVVDVLRLARRLQILRQLLACLPRRASQAWWDLAVQARRSRGRATGGLAWCAACRHALCGGGGKDTPAGAGPWPWLSSPPLHVWRSSPPPLSACPPARPRIASRCAAGVASRRPRMRRAARLRHGRGPTV